MSWPPSWEGHLGKQVAELKCGVSHSPLSCSSRIINSLSSEQSFEPLCHCCTGRKIWWKESRRLELRSHFICVASGESSSLRYPLKRKEKSENAAVFNGDFVDIMYRWVFLVPLFLYLAVASFPLISTSVPKENHEDSLKCCCSAQGSIDKRQKLVSINALCCVVILQHIFWLEKMCRVTIPGYRECQISCPSQDPDMAGFGKCLFFLLYVYMCFSR